jgi:hypothetical protein
MLFVASRSPAPPLRASGRPRRWRDVAVLLGLVCIQTAVAADDRSPTSFADYLAIWKIDRPGRAVLEEAGEWSDAKRDVALRVLGRLARIPEPLAARWGAAAEPFGAAAATELLGDRLLAVSGRATRVDALPLPAEQAEIYGRKQLETVRLVLPDGRAVDLLAVHVPKAWPRGMTIDEPAGAVGLPLAAGAGPGAAEGAAALLLATARVAWFPDTMLGRLGVDEGLFDGVVDGQQLVPGDAEAFWSVLTAAGRCPQESLATAAGPPGDILPLIDPAQRWFEEHRGAPFTIEGVARRATRIEVDDPLVVERIGADHYWELFVFVPTPLLRINGRLQDDYPVVCCVRTLPAGMPTGPRIGERVRVSGFAFKRYGYPLPDVTISSSQGDRRQQGQRQETALLVGREPVWLPAPNPARAVDALGWGFLGVAALIGLAVVGAAWALARDRRVRERQARRAMPDRIELP